MALAHQVAAKRREERLRREEEERRIVGTVCDDRAAREPRFHDEEAAGQKSGGRQLASAWLCGLDRDRAELPRAEILRPTPRMETVNDFVQSSEAKDIISKFCEGHPVTRVEPTENELSALWNRCAALDEASLAAAIYGQLAGAIDSHVWQPRLRALNVLEHFFNQEASRPTARKVAAKAERLIQHFVEEEAECHDAACRVLLLKQLAEVLPEGQEVRMANEGGLLYFVAESPTRHEAPVNDEEGLLHFVAESPTRREAPVNEIEVSHQTTKALRPGMEVIVHGLKASTEFNGKLGILQAWDEARGRWSVALADGQQKKLKPDNLKANLQTECKPTIEKREQEDLNLISLVQKSKSEREEDLDLISFSDPAPLDLIELSDLHCAAATSPEGHGGYLKATSSSAAVEAAGPASTGSPSSVKFESYGVELDYSKLKDRVPRIFNMAESDVSSDTQSNPELTKMFSFAPRQVPTMPFLSHGRAAPPLGPDPFASVVADTYVQCLKASA